MRKAKLGIFIGTHGRGSNMNAIIEACESGEIKAEVAVVIAPNDTSAAVALAKEKGVRVEVIPYDREDYAKALLSTLRDAGCYAVCLAGYMKLLPENVLQAYPDRVLNIHPALLPKYGGKGMYGKHVHEAVIAAGEKESGCTIHFVNERYDEGAIFLQLRCPLRPTDTPEKVAERVLKLEHKAYPMAIKELLKRHGF